MVMVYDRRQQGLQQLADWLSMQRQGYQQRAAQTAETQAASARQQRELHARYLQGLIANNKGHEADIMAQNPADFAGINYAPDQFVKTPEEQARAAYEKWKLDHTQDPSKPLTIDPVTASLFDPSLANAKPFFEAANPRTLYANQNDVAPEVIQTQRVNDKLALDAPQQDAANFRDLKFREIDKPESVATIRNKNAQTGLYGAETGKNVAETGKIKEETRGLVTTNGLLSGGTGNSTVSGATVPLEKAPAIVQMLVNRTYDPTLMRRFKSQEQDALLSAARKYDPQLNFQDYPEQFAIKKDFASGKAKQNVQALNTAIGHLHDMWKASSEIDNFDSIPLVNTLVNAGKNKAAVGSGGGKGVIRFNAAVTGASGELGALYKGGVGSDAEIKEWRANANPNYADDQRAAAIQQLAHMVGARFNALAANYARTGRSGDELINATARKQLQDMGIDPATFDIAASGKDGAADQEFISGAMKMVNPATGQPYTEAEARAELQRRKGG